ncbi:hypothetical protein Btru_013914 [Bulinus truncatus]|nr:hypothetical protein Btru_013914 [Bulinus truncatus]
MGHILSHRCYIASSGNDEEKLEGVELVLSVKKGGNISYLFAGVELLLRLALHGEVCIAGIVRLILKSRDFHSDKYVAMMEVVTTGSESVIDSFISNGCSAMCRVPKIKSVHTTLILVSDGVDTNWKNASDVIRKVIAVKRRVIGTGASTLELEVNKSTLELEVNKSTLELEVNKSTLELEVNKSTLELEVCWLNDSHIGLLQGRVTLSCLKSLVMEREIIKNKHDMSAIKGRTCLSGPPLLSEAGFRLELPSTITTDPPSPSARRPYPEMSLAGRATAVYAQARRVGSLSNEIAYSHVDYGHPASCGQCPVQTSEYSHESKTDRFVDANDGRAVWGQSNSRQSWGEKRWDR